MICGSPHWNVIIILHRGKLDYSTKCIYHGWMHQEQKYCFFHTFSSINIVAVWIDTCISSVCLLWCGLKTVKFNVLKLFNGQFIS